MSPCALWPGKGWVKVKVRVGVVVCIELRIHSGCEPSHRRSNDGDNEAIAKSQFATVSQVIVCPGLMLLCALG